MSVFPSSHVSLSAGAAAAGLAELGLFLLGVLVISIPSGLLGFALCFLLASLLALRLLFVAASPFGWPLRILCYLTVAVIAMSLLSVVHFDYGLRDLDNRMRFLVLPWAALLAYALQPRQVWLWRGALVGIFGALLVALLQVMNGAERADGWTNAIVFADIVMLLLALVVFCRPIGQGRWVMAAVLAALVVIVLSGTRGVWLSLLALLGVLVWDMRWRSVRMRLFVFAGLGGIAALLVFKVPALNEQLRIVELRQDIQRYEGGDSDSSAGARMERLHVAWDTLVAHPLFGVGIRHFDDAMRQLPICSDGVWRKRCHLGHAHNDLAEWGATQGVPGLLLLLAVYGAPLYILVRLYRQAGASQFRGPAAAGIMVVVGYILCGITQSMFAHQVTVGFYVSVVGVLIGLAARQAQIHSINRPADPAPGRPQIGPAATTTA